MTAEIDFGWNDLVLSMPAPHFLQTGEWAAIKEKVGWQTRQLTWKDGDGKVNAAAQVLIREVRPARFLLGLRVGYIPRGPLMDWSDDDLRSRVLADLVTFARREGLIFLKIDPEVEVGRGVPGRIDQQDNPPGIALLQELKDSGWRFSPEQVQFRNTVMLDLDGTEDDWLARMKQKTRYNLRLARKSGVTVRKATLDELPYLYVLYAETAARDGFIIRPEEYYLEVWGQFLSKDLATALIAEVEGELVAGLVLFHLGHKAWYVYGMSSSRHREKMPNYLLQWEAMRIAREKGCSKYDLWGAPDEFDSEDGMVGVFRFKEGLGGQVVRTIGAWDLPIKPLLYYLYQVVLPKILEVTRRIRRRQIKREVA